MFFSTHDLAATRRQAAWREAVVSHCGEFELEFNRSVLDASLQLRRIGSLECARLSQSVRRVFRRDYAAMRAQAGDCFVLLQVAGRARLTQFDRETAVAPGAVVLIDAGAPFEIELCDRNLQLCIHVPKDRLADHGAGWERKLGTQLAASTSYILHSLLGSVFGVADSFSDAEGEILAGTLLSLISAATIDGHPTSPRSTEKMSETMQKVKSYIIRNLKDETLSPGMIASATALSERHLHRIFKTSGESVAQWIRQARLERCASELRNPALRERSITEIAFGWGFNDSAHFSRIFRKDFGVPPREYRRAVLTH